MALATQCPYCQTRFRVASDQLKLRGGIVRCGACQRIFDGSAHLIDLDAAKSPSSPAVETGALPVAETGARPAAAPETAAPAAPAPLPSPEFSTEPAPEAASAAAPASSLPEQEAHGVDFASQPVYTLDFTSTFDPLGILPKAAPDAAAEAAVSDPAPQDPEPPHGDVLAHAVEASVGVQVDVDLPPPNDDAVAPAVAEAQPQALDPEPPHGDALAHALEAGADAGEDAGLVVDVDLPPPDDEMPEPAVTESQPQPEPEPAPQDAEPPHGDVLAHAVHEAAVDPDAVVPRGGIEPAESQAQPQTQPQAQPQDPEPPHGDVPAYAVDTPSFAPQGRIEPRIEPWADPRIEPRLAPDDDAPAASSKPAASELVEPPAPAAAQPPAPPSASAPPSAPVPAAPRSFAPPGRIEPSFDDLPVDEELVAQPLPGDEPDPPLRAAPDSVAPDRATADDSAPLPALPLRASAASEPAEPATGADAPAPRSARARAAEARARRTKLTPTRIETPRLRVPETDEPEFVKRSRKQEQSGRTRRILMAIGIVVLLLVLAAQLVLNFRNVLAARYPGARPALGAACALLGCRVELPTQIDNLAIENGELTTLGPGTYSLNTLLRNQGSLVQAWPSIELELTDANDKTVLRRVFAPGEYLPQNLAHNGAGVASGFGARSEQPVKLHFALADLKPSGYHIFIFYP